MKETLSHSYPILNLLCDFPKEEIILRCQINPDIEDSQINRQVIKQYADDMIGNETEYGFWIQINDSVQYGYHRDYYEFSDIRL